MNETTDNFAEPMFATKDSVLSKFTDDELKKELENRGYKPIWVQELKNMIDADLGTGLE
ncbi:MAG: hypothetical protein JNN05_10615 [Candidatus Omnitrophica bacterium]|nr:hypothetical protein [Candidatus Omnitrophota bacterium]